MAFAILIIKKSKNVHAWQNEFVGQKVKARINDDGTYSVVFADNVHLRGINQNWLVGGLDHDLNTVEEIQNDGYIINPLLQR